MDFRQHFEISQCFWQIYGLKIQPKYKNHDNSNKLFCCFSIIIAMVNWIPRLWNSSGRRLGETWGGPQTEPSMDFRRVNTELSIDFRLIWNRQYNLGGPIRKPILNRMWIWDDLVFRLLDFNFSNSAHLLPVGMCGVAERKCPPAIVLYEVKPARSIPSYTFVTLQQGTGIHSNRVLRYSDQIEFKYSTLQRIWI